MAAVIATVLLVGCGAEKEPVASAPAQCLEDWNAQSTSQTFGQHVYDTHDSRRVQVAVLKPVTPTPNIDEEGACAAIFAVPESDYEYGYVGLVETDLGWASMQELARDDPTAQDEIQADASAAANATLLPDGKLEGS